jgi:hypothetical protein
MPEEQDIHPDDDGYQREHVEHDDYLSVHSAFLLRGAVVEPERQSFAETVGAAWHTPVMTSSDPLAGLDDVAWSDVGHAYGPADDVPDLLRALTAHDADVREECVQRLYGNIFHQGTRYEATAYAVPFLARLALDPGTFRRAEIVDMLGSITVGYDEAHLPNGIDPAGQRAEYERLLSGRAQRMREFQRRVAVAPHATERQRREWRRQIYDYEAEIRAADDRLEAYAAVRAQIPQLRALLAADDAELRASVAYLLAWFPEDEAAKSLAALTSLLEHEDDPRVTATAIITMGLIGSTELTPDLVRGLQNRLASTDSLERWAAATALARLGDHGPEVARALADAAAQPPEAADTEGEEGEEDRLVRFLDGDIRGYSSLSLVLLADSVTPEVFDAILDGLARSSEIGAFSIAGATLRLAFPEGPAEELSPFSDLDDRQQRVVRVLADLDTQTWHWGNFTDIVRAWRLPAWHTELRAYAGLPPIG